ncbi:MAG: hypothetical protein CMJ31_05515 [Phycisphaerae bacterium]|nr:hypothetical protein [Phycisphaerae bacterium]
MNSSEHVHCPACGYLLDGLGDAICPECGVDPGTFVAKPVLDRLYARAIAGPIAVCLMWVALLATLSLLWTWWAAVFLALFVSYVGLVWWYFLDGPRATRWRPIIVREARMWGPALAGIGWFSWWWGGPLRLFATLGVIGAAGTAIAVGAGHSKLRRRTIAHESPVDATSRV